jgi:hypothetical protein
MEFTKFSASLPKLELAIELFEGVELEVGAKTVMVVTSRVGLINFV